MKKFAFCFFILTLAACGNKERKSSNVLFAGEIVNPTDEYVILYKDDEEIDSARLDADNRFSFRLDNIEEGLHNFKHTPEYQYVYLEKGDSIMIRLNTTDFDESLVFSGRGEEINNFLIEMFLTNEEEEWFISTLYSLEPEAFSAKIDSLRGGKINLLNTMTTEADISDSARDMAEASIDYNYFIYKEMYPFYYKRQKGQKNVPSLSSDFYSYREDLNLNSKDLIYFRPYYKFINYHLGNLTFMQCLEDCDLHEDTRSYLHFNRHKLSLIDSLITEKELRDNVFRHVAIDYLLNVKDNEANNRTFIDDFHKRSGNNRHIREINNLYEGIRNIQPNMELPELMLVDHEGEQTSLREIARDKKAVFYFWSATQRGHFDNIVDRVKKLSKQHPEYTFVGISFNTEHNRWLSMIDAKGLDKAVQFRSDDFEELTNTLIVYPMNKAIIAQDSVIVDAFANLYTSF